MVRGINGEAEATIGKQLNESSSRLFLHRLFFVSILLDHLQLIANLTAGLATVSHYLRRLSSYRLPPLSYTDQESKSTSRVLNRPPLSQRYRRIAVGWYRSRADVLKFLPLAFFHIQMRLYPVLDPQIQRSCLSVLSYRNFDAL